MPGTCDFQLSGRVTFVQNNPPTTTKPYSSFRIRLVIPMQYIGTNVIGEHSLFLGIKYAPSDMSAPRFKDFESKLQKGVYLFARGSIKPKEASPDGKYPAGLYVDAPWKQVKLSQIPFQPRNKVYFDGEVVGVEENTLNLKYMYTNPKETNPDERWKERHYSMTISPEATIDLRPRENVFVEGRIFGVDANNNQLTWMLVDEAY